MCTAVSKDPKAGLHPPERSSSSCGGGNARRALRMVDVQVATEKGGRVRVWAAAQGGRNVGRCGTHGDSHTHCPLVRVVSVGWEALKRGWEALKTGWEALKRLLSQVVWGVEFVWEQGQPASTVSWNWVIM